MLPLIIGPSPAPEPAPRAAAGRGRAARPQPEVEDAELANVADQRPRRRGNLTGAT